MEQFKDWVKKHKALAIGGGIALLVLLYLWLRSGSSANTGASSNSALSSYYAAEAASTQGASQQVIAQDQLQAAENATNTQGAVYQAAIAAQKAPIQAQLDELTTLANLKAYQDFLGASKGTQASSTSNTNYELGYAVNTGVGNPVPAGTPLLYNYGRGGISTLTNPATGQVYPNASGAQGEPEVAPGSLTPVYWAGAGSPIQSPTIATTPATITSPIQPGQFNGFSMPVL